jgi:hypothetical protein
MGGQNTERHATFWVIIKTDLFIQHIGKNNEKHENQNDRVYGRRRRIESANICGAFHIFARTNYYYPPEHSLFTYFLYNLLFRQWPFTKNLKVLNLLQKKARVYYIWQLWRRPDIALEECSSFCVGYCTIPGATGYGQDEGGIGVRVPVGSRIFSSPRRPDLLWGPPNLLSNGYWGLFPRG